MARYTLGSMPVLLLAYCASPLSDWRNASLPWPMPVAGGPKSPPGAGTPPRGVVAGARVGGAVSELPNACMSAPALTAAPSALSMPALGLKLWVNFVMSAPERAAAPSVAPIHSLKPPSPVGTPGDRDGVGLAGGGAGAARDGTAGAGSATGAGAGSGATSTWEGPGAGSGAGAGSGRGCASGGGSTGGAAGWGGSGGAGGADGCPPNAPPTIDWISAIFEPIICCRPKPCCF